MITACVNNVKRYGTGSLSQEASPGADLPSANRGSDTAPAKTQNHELDPACGRSLPCRRAFADQNLASTARACENPGGPCHPGRSPGFLQPIRNQDLRVAAALKVAGVARHQRQAMRTCNRGLKRIGKLPARAAAEASRIVCDFHGHR